MVSSVCSKRVDGWKEPGFAKSFSVYVNGRLISMVVGYVPRLVKEEGTIMVMIVESPLVVGAMPCVVVGCLNGWHQRILT